MSDADEIVTELVNKWDNRWDEFTDPQSRSELEVAIAAAIRRIEAERGQALKIERLALAQVKETTAVLDQVSAQRNRLAKRVERFKAVINDSHDVPPEHDSEPMPFHKGWELAVRRIAAALSPSTPEGGGE